MSKPILTLTNNDIQAAAKQRARELIITGICHPNIAVALYGVPRGGVTAAAFLKAALIAEGMTALLVDHPASATIIVDDLVDSGRTRENYLSDFPTIPFVALYYKPAEWLVFPWEGSELASADDIPIRLLQFIGETPEREGLQETPGRFLKAWQAYTAGYATDPRALLKTFEDGAEKYDELVLVRSIPVYSQCEHHLAPFFGVAHVGYIPDGRVVGLSKLARVVDGYMRRLQVQERLTQQIAHAINDELKPRGVAVVLECRHMCMESRGVKTTGAVTSTSCLLGVFKQNASARAEFLQLIR